MAPVVAAYQAMRGASFLVAVTFAAEIGDVRRFDNPRQLMGFLGLVPRERSTGERVRRSGLTLAGNRRARRVLVEAAWSYRHPARVSQILQDRLEGLPKAIRDIAWKAQLRLCGRYRRLSAAGKKLPVVIAAVAREMAAFLWAIGHKSRPPDHQHRHGRAAQHRGRSHGGESPSLVMWPGSTRRSPFRKRIAPRRRHEGGSQPADKSLIDRRLKRSAPGSVQLQAHSVLDLFTGRAADLLLPSLTGDAPLRPTSPETVESRAFAGPRMSRRHNTPTAPAISP